MQKWQNLIKNQQVNWKMIPIKIFGFFLIMGTDTVFPYLTLQMLNIGMTYEDVSLIYGITPIMTSLTSPVAGNEELFNDLIIN